MRELRKIKDKRNKNRNINVKRLIIAGAALCVIAAAVVVFMLTRTGTGPHKSDLTPGKFYTQEVQEEEHEEGEGKGKTGDKGAVKVEDMTFYKMLSSKEDSITPLDVDAEKENNRVEKKIQPHQSEKISQIDKQIARHIEENKVIDDTYAVQVAAFSSKEAARKVASKLKMQGYEPYIIKGKGGAGIEILYKIRVGKFPSRVDAQESSKSLKKDGYDTYVVRSSDY